MMLRMRFKQTEMQFMLSLLQPKLIENGGSGGQKGSQERGLLHIDPRGGVKSKLPGPPCLSSARESCQDARTLRQLQPTTKRNCCLS